MMRDVGVLRGMRERYRGAPESLRRALREAASSSELPRLSRRELQRAAEAVALPQPAWVGQVRFVAVVPGGEDGCVYLAVASDLPRSDLTPVPPELAARVQAYVRSTWPRLIVQGLDLYLSGPAPGGSWSGRSCELALMVALVSAATGVRPRGGVVLTGTLEEAGDTGVVSSLVEKRERVVADVEGGRLVVGGARAETILSEVLETGWRRAVAPGGVKTARRTARRARAALDENRLDEALALSAEVLDMDADTSATALAWWVRGAAALHLGRAEQGLEALDAVLQVLPVWTASDAAPPESWTREEVVAWFLVALVDAGRVATALERGVRTLDDMSAWPGRDRRWRRVALQLAGSTHRAAVAMGELETARSLLEDVSLGEAELDEETARCLGDLAEVERKAGRRGVARAHIEEARDALLDMPHSQRARTAEFLDLYAARLDEPVILRDGLWPGRGFEVLQAEQHKDLPRLLRLAEASSGSLGLTWVCLAACARISNAVPREARRLVDAWSFDDPSLEAMRMGVVSGELTAFRKLAARCPY